MATLAVAVRVGVVKKDPVAPEIGLVVTPDDPAYHWKVGLAAVTVRVVDSPLLDAYRNRFASD